MTLTYPAAPADADPVLAPLMDALHVCLCGELAAAGRGVCDCALVPGAMLPPADRCDCACEEGVGQAWVRWVQDEPVKAPGGAGKGVRTGCTPLRTVKVVELGVYRCVAVMGEDGEPPSYGDRKRDTLGLLQDRAVLLKALACCHALRGKRWELRRVEPTAVRGGCAGVMVQFAVDV